MKLTKFLYGILAVETALLVGLLYERRVLSQDQIRAEEYLDITQDLLIAASEQIDGPLVISRELSERMKFFKIMDENNII